MAQGKKGSGEVVKFATTRGVGLVAAAHVGPLSQAFGERVTDETVDRIAHLAGLVWMRGGAIALTGISPGKLAEPALLAALGIDSAPQAHDPNREHQALVDLYHDSFKAARGVAPKMTVVDFRRFRELRQAIGFDAAKQAISGAFLDSFWKTKVTIQKIAADPSLFLGRAACAKPSGSLQREGVQP